MISFPGSVFVYINWMVIVVSLYVFRNEVLYHLYYPNLGNILKLGISPHSHHSLTSPPSLATNSKHTPHSFRPTPLILLCITPLLLSHLSAHQSKPQCFLSSFGSSVQAAVFSPHNTALLPFWCSSVPGINLPAVTWKYANFDWFLLEQLSNIR